MIKRPNVTPSVTLLPFSKLQIIDIIQYTLGCWLSTRDHHLPPLKYKQQLGFSLYTLFLLTQRNAYFATSDCYPGNTLSLSTRLLSYFDLIQRNLIRSRKKHRGDGMQWGQYGRFS